ncbi:MAG: hypothetical protein Q27BPR15_13070 [Rhodobacter sp. CACIA14H1]|nr:MAG: hypothetical protein Q27BPR15_13070 [Rhodobacter sp. CACIA14H1]
MSEPTEAEAPIGQPVVIAPPARVETPDRYTRQGPNFIENGAPNQVFRFCKWGIEYGTDDKGHAAAIIISTCLLLLLCVLFVIGAIVERGWIGDALQIVGTAFTITAGVAIGKGAEASKKDEE